MSVIHAPHVSVRRLSASLNFCNELHCLSSVSVLFCQVDSSSMSYLIQLPTIFKSEQVSRWSKSFFPILQIASSNPRWSKKSHTFWSFFLCNTDSRARPIILCPAPALLPCPVSV
jgi:hypothetical protein